ncbi:MAG: hypothetical protein LRZ85_03860 [Alphaproteobacteria bacterium]|nr:hypothetical protein [Alphaproteobacteria bacterium]
MIQPAPAPAMDVPVNNASVLEGFGSDIPLVMALQQIVPPEYTYSFASGVNPGESVSWEGGKSWAQVLSEMLSQEGLRASITGKSIQIREGLYDQRADASLAAPSAEDLAATMPAAGAEEPEKPIATPVEKVEAVPPVTPPEILAQAPKGPTRVLGRISENGGLQVQEIKETVQIQGSPEAAARARHDVTERALGLEDASAEVVPEAPLAKITSFSVTKTEHKVAGEVPAVKAAAPVPASAQSAVRRHNYY